MRPIEFRGKGKDNGEWVYGYYWKNLYSGTHFIMQPSIKGLPDVINAPVIPETVGQFTGLKDKNGKEIFEGDVVQCLSGWWPGVVSTQSEGYMGWCIEPLKENRHRGRYGMNWDYDFEVIGNIHEKDKT